MVDGKGGKAELVPAVRRWVNAHGRNVTLPGKSHSRFLFGNARLINSDDRILRDSKDIAR